MSPEGRDTCTIHPSHPSKAVNSSLTIDRETEYRHICMYLLYVKFAVILTAAIVF
jgi:hypothetical protein